MRSSREEDSKEGRITHSDLKTKFHFKSLVERRALVVSSEGMEPAKFDSMRKAAKAIDKKEGIIRYARNNGRNFVRMKMSRCFS